MMLFLLGFAFGSAVTVVVLAILGGSSMPTAEEMDLIKQWRLKSITAERSKPVIAQTVRLGEVFVSAENSEALENAFRESMADWDIPTPFADWWREAAEKLDDEGEK